MHKLFVELGNKLSKLRILFVYSMLAPLSIKYMIKMQNSSI